jgi:hypothetical protein
MLIFSGCSVFNNQAPIYSDRQEVFNNILKVQADSQKGFDWPFYVYVPEAVSSQSKSVILVEPLSDGKANDDFGFHDKAAFQLIKNRKSIADELGTPLIIPVFHRKKDNYYTHALGRSVMLRRYGQFNRLDLQLLAMVDDLRSKLSDRKINTYDSILMMGFSSSGMFTNRFVIMHPERIIAASIGSPGGWPMVPIAEWNNIQLTYPVGVGDFEVIIDKPFNLETFKKIPQFFYIGSEDDNDSVPYSDSYEPKECQIVMSLFGKTPISRWPRAKHIYENVAPGSNFVTYSGIGHSSKYMRDDVVAFLEKELKNFLADN